MEVQEVSDVVRVLGAEDKLLDHKALVLIDKEYDSEIIWWTYHSHGEYGPELEQDRFEIGHRVVIPVFKLPEDKQKWLEDGFPAYTKLLVTGGDFKGYVGYYKLRPANNVKTKK